MATLLVRKDGSGAYTAIQPAIYDAQAGDTVNVGPGTYTENVELYKSITLEGAGKDQTFIQGKLGNDSVTASWFAGDSTLTVSSTANLIKGKILSGTNITTGSRIAEIINPTQIRLDLNTATSGNYSKVAATLTQGSSTIVLPSTTSVVVGHKVEGTGVNATITAWNSTTKTITLSSPVTQSGSNVTLTFRVPRSNVTVNQLTNASGYTSFGTIAMYGTTNGLQIKNLCVLGFDGNVANESAALSLNGSASPGHQNFLIDNCRFTAIGDSAVATGGNAYLSGGTFQNCVFDGKTFLGDEPADVPAFSTFTTSVVVQSVGASSSVIRFTDLRGVIVGSTMTSTGNYSGTGTVTAISGNDVTVNKVITAAVGASISVTLTNIQFIVPNCARNLVYIGQNFNPSNSQNITFKNNLIQGQTGAVIASSGNKTMFNSAVTIECVGGLVENNVIDGFIGAGDPNPLASNWAIRCRQAGTVVQNNVNYMLGGRVNSGYLIGLDYGPNVGTNTSIVQELVSAAQALTGAPVTFKMSKSLVQQLAAVQASPTFSNEANWKLVGYVFKKVNSSVRIVSAFRNFDAEKPYTLKNNMLPGDKFEMHKLILSTPARTLLVIKRAELTNPTIYDFTLK